jgi:hypothetical protein
MNDENLIPLNQRSKEEAKEIQRMGGKARGNQLTEEKKARKIVKAWLNKSVKKEDGSETTQREVLIQKLCYEAYKDVDLKKIDYILRLAGEAPEDKVSVSAEEGTNITLNIDGRTAQSLSDIMKKSDNK